MSYARLAGALGIKGRVAGHQMYSRCPLHSDKLPSFSLSLQTGAWTCHAGCGPQDGRDFATLVVLMRGCTYTEALAWMRSTAPLVPSNEQLHDDIERLLAPETVAENEQLLAWYRGLSADVMPLDFMRRGFSWNTIQYYGLRYDPHMDAVAIPFWSYPDQRFVGASLRRMHPGDAPKYHNTPGLDKNQHLYPLHPRDGHERIILVEGQLDALWWRQQGREAVAISGSSLSSAQVALLKQHRQEMVYLAFDNDEAGRDGTKRALDVLLEAGWMMTMLRLIEYPPGRKDANDCTGLELTEAFFTAKEII